MTVVDVLISSLKNWDKLSALNQINDFKGMLDSILLHLGIIVEITNKSKEDLLVKLEERVEYLIEEEGIDGDLLVMGLVNFITESLEATLMKQGQTIVLDEQLLSSKQTNLDLKNRLSSSLKKLKKDSFYKRATKELDQWKAIVTTNFTKGKRAQWKKESLQVATEDLDKYFCQIPQNILEILFDIPIIKLITKIDLSNIKDLSYSEALKLREELL